MIEGSVSPDKSEQVKKFKREAVETLLSDIHRKTANINIEATLGVG